MTIHASQASTHDIVLNPHRSYPPHHNTRRILRFQSLLLLNNLILQSCIFISQPMFLSIYIQISNLPTNSSTQSKRDLIKNKVLEKYEIPLIRFATNRNSEKEKLIKKLEGLQ